MKKYIYTSCLCIAALSCLLALVFFLYFTTPHSCKNVKIAQNDSLKFHIDHIDKRGFFLHIIGWAFQPGTDTDRLRAFVALKNENGIYVLNTRTVERKDLTTLFASQDEQKAETRSEGFYNPFVKDKLYAINTNYTLHGKRLFYDRAGFEAKAWTYFLDPGEYTVCIIYTFDDQTLLYQTEKRIHI